jgi:hypothetical protein
MIAKGTGDEKIIASLVEKWGLSRDQARRALADYGDEIDQARRARLNPSRPMTKAERAELIKAKEAVERLGEVMFDSPSFSDEDMYPLSNAYSWLGYLLDR